jgi:hypothetical protein
MGDSEGREATLSIVNLALYYAEKNFVNEAEQTNKLNKLDK